MHFYFAKHDHEIAIVSVGLVDEHIQKLAGNIPVYSSFDDLPDSVSSVAVVSNFPLDEALLPNDRDISYIFIGIGMFIIPPDNYNISLCVEDDESLQSIFEAICTSDEGKGMNIDPLEFELKGKRFYHLKDIMIDEIDTFDTSALEELNGLWFHQRSFPSYASIVKINQLGSEAKNFLFHSGAELHTNQLRIIGITEPMEQISSNFPCEGQFGGVSVCFRVGDITKESCDAIVNSANVYLQKGSGVCGAIFEAAGAELSKACKDILQQHGERIRIGESIVTEGFNLKAKNIIHSVSPRCMFQWNDDIQKELYNAYFEIFETAQREGYESIAIPAMGIGKHYCDLDRCVTIAMMALEEYLYRPDKRLKRIVFVLSDESIAEKYLQEFFHSHHYQKTMAIRDHQEGFEDEAKFHRALGYMLSQYSKFSTRQLKHILSIFHPELVERLFIRKECHRILQYVGETDERFSKDKFYESTTFNGSTYELINDIGDIGLCGFSYFEWVDEGNMQ